MKIGIVGDIHWSRYSSILRLRGNKYSYRLENCIQSINWAEKTTSTCDLIVYLGDFFDSSDLSAEELTAINELNWNNSPHYFLVGNHEMGINNLSYSSSHIFDSINMNEGGFVVSNPLTLYYLDTNIHLIPYILENARKPIIEYINKDDTKKNIIFSHNDIAGIQMGNFISKSGFSIKEIEDNCDLFINGHLHNGSKITDKIINIGNLTGQNFSEDALKYSHCIFILDTDTMSISVYENPYATHFYKIDVTNSIFDFNTLKSNSVVTLKTYENEQAKYRSILDNNPNIIASRLIIAPTETMTTVANSQELFSINHLKKFNDYILDTLGKSDIVIKELSEVLY